MNQLNSRIENIKINRKLAASKISPFLGKFLERSNVRINPPIEIKKLIEIEKKYKVELPTEYRLFLTTIANGGLGYLLSLERSVQYSLQRPYKYINDRDYFKTPFIHTSAYNPDDDPDFDKICDLEDCQEISEEVCDLASDAIYDYSTAGNMVISNTMCGVLRLVINCYLLLITCYFNSSKHLRNS